jgi:hypothetical protein
VQAAGAVIDGNIHVALDTTDFLAIFARRPAGSVRLVGTVREEAARTSPERISWEDVSRRVMGWLPIEVGDVNWFSTYRVHHRVAERFRRGRAFLLGDAAHIHSPVGGQGMNTGIGDAVNLAWKLAAVLAGRAPDRLLDSYESERISFAKRLVATTDRAFTLVSAEGAFAELLRTRIAPFLLPKIIEFSFAREYLFRTVSQITLNYRDGPLSEGVVGDIRGGDRLPWAPFDGDDNFSPLASMDWQLHVYGRASDEITQWSRKHDVALHQFPWRDVFEKAGFVRDTAYLVRPDMYIGLAGAAPDTLDIYFSKRGIRP